MFVSNKIHLIGFIKIYFNIKNVLIKMLKYFFYVRSYRFKNCEVLAFGIYTKKTCCLNEQQRF